MCLCLRCRTYSYDFTNKYISKQGDLGFFAVVCQPTDRSDVETMIGRWPSRDRNRTSKCDEERAPWRRPPSRGSAPACWSAWSRGLRLVAPSSRPRLSVSSGFWNPSATLRPTEYAAVNFFCGKCEQMKNAKTETQKNVESPVFLLRVNLYFESCYMSKL